VSQHAPVAQRDSRAAREPSTALQGVTARGGKQPTTVRARGCRPRNPRPTSINGSSGPCECGGREESAKWLRTVNAARSSKRLAWVSLACQAQALHYPRSGRLARSGFFGGRIVCSRQRQSANRPAGQRGRCSILVNAMAGNSTAGRVQGCSKGLHGPPPHSMSWGIHLHDRRIPTNGRACVGRWWWK